MNLYPPIDWTQYPLHIAAMSGNKGEVERLIAQHADVNENLDLPGTPLHVAICHCLMDDPLFRHQGHVDVVKVLLENGADIQAQRVYEGTPLHDAARKGFVHIAELLLSHAADINSKEEDQRRTPLHRAVAANKLRMVQYLLSSGADVNAVADFTPLASSARIYPDFWLTPLQLAAREALVKMAQILLEAGAVVAAPAPRPKEPIAAPVLSPKKLLTTLTLRPEGLSALELAVRSKQESEAKYDQLIQILTAQDSGGQ